MINNQDLAKLRKIVKEQHPTMSEDEIDALTDRYMELAHLLLQVWLKDNATAHEDWRSHEKDSEPTEAPP